MVCISLTRRHFSPSSRTLIELKLTLHPVTTIFLIPFCGVGPPKQNVTSGNTVVYLCCIACLCTSSFLMPPPSRPLKKHSSHYEPMNHLTGPFCFRKIFLVTCSIIESTIHLGGLVRSYYSTTCFNCRQWLTPERLVTPRELCARLVSMSSPSSCLSMLFNHSFFAAWLHEKTLTSGLLIQAH